MLEARYDELLKEAYNNIQACVLKQQKENHEKVRRAELEAKKTLLKKREDIIDAVFSEAEKKLEEFRADAKYAVWLKQKLERALCEVGDGEKELYISGDDLELLDGADLCGVEVKTVSDNELRGGLRVKNPARGIMADYSFSELLKNERADFLQKSGLRVE